MLSINELTITQNGFRNGDQIRAMVAFVADGGVFEYSALKTYSAGQDTRPINIVRFEDGRLYIHDGHHRIAAIYLGGRTYLHDSEYVITDWKYSDYTVINFEVKWVTPYDPRSEVRISDYWDFKQRAFDYLRDSEATVRIYIIDSYNSGVYTRPRTALTIQDFFRYI